MRTATTRRNVTRPRRRAKAVAKPAAFVPWEETLQKTKMGSLAKLFVEQVMRLFIECASKWEKAVAELSSEANKELPVTEQLKRFFALNPFGCRNSKMLTCLSIILKVPVSEITPDVIASSESNDGSEDENKNMGFLNLAPPGTAIKVIGRNPSFRKNILEDALGDIFFRSASDSSDYSKIVVSCGDINSFYMPTLIDALTAMPEHYRAATPEELLPILVGLPFNKLEKLTRIVFPSEVHETLFANSRSKVREEDTED